MFGKIMRLPDALMQSYYQLLTDFPEEQFSQEIAQSPARCQGEAGQAHHHLAAQPMPRRRIKPRGNSCGPRMAKFPQMSLRSKIIPGPHKLAPLMVQGRPGSASNSEAIRKIKEGP